MFCKPCLQFVGEEFETDHELKCMKNLFIDMFKGVNYEKLSKDAIQYCICFFC